ncbi:hypothetical protein [Flavobacterium sp. 25HG05S-40]|uniref:hypothetical protein n=1 Tax=Flavobacterium sp. 25HG05S-40 TaxID=3458682 RepID=UPI0040450005
MKTLRNIRNGLFVGMALLLLACSSGKYANSGTAHDRTGTNGATNGNGKAPRGK